MRLNNVLFMLAIASNSCSSHQAGQQPMHGVDHSGGPSFDSETATISEVEVTEEAPKEAPVENPAALIVPSADIPPTEVTVPAISVPTVIATNPPVQRTTVVVNNGRVIPRVVGSFWFTYPESETVIDTIISSIQAQTSGDAISFVPGDGRKTLCVDNSEDGRNDFLAFLFSHLAHAFKNPDVRYTESEQNCADGKPNFAKYFAGALNRANNKNPYAVFACRDSNAGVYTIKETAAAEKTVKTVISFQPAKDMESKATANAWHFRKFGIDALGVFSYESGATKLTLNPMRHEEGRIAGTLVTSSGTIDLQCSMILNVDY